MKYLNLNSLPDDLKELCLKSKDDPDAKYEKVNLAPGTSDGIEFFNHCDEIANKLSNEKVQLVEEC